MKIICEHALTICKGDRCMFNSKRIDNNENNRKFYFDYPCKQNNGQTLYIRFIKIIEDENENTKNSNS
jgi:hypothetical protein